ncbi:hypothetical protein SETIT_3G259500v2 [Setaria italica]|uniref:SAWADEE domain-containing protein n=2 Tax=Setaria TaxID=4554 RepID=K3ZD47_SETIT|nr:uncharacterized protein LOC101762433 [Setaria italica]XP_034588119.1 uncharacterized protein LOC117850403 [Setaria viridis]RCV17925.1 hypothetical protein SETIT_3G259500v2 [Setaria italica]TKW27576.1 hypothetical protein SEVIR_3G266000v2 [Setaria viridis]
MPPTGRKRKARPSQPARRPRSLSRLDFRSPSDGAWYGARVTVQHGALRVMYEEFPEEQDEWYDPATLAAASSARYGVAALRARFRAPAPPLDDAGCRDLRAGAPLCVSCPLDGGLLKFYDAVLESVSPAAHGVVNGEDRCACRFAVRWTEGPRAGSREEVGVERVCCVQSTPVEDPVLSEFFDGVTKLLGGNGDGGATASQEIGAVAAAEDSVPADAPPGFHWKFGARA